MIQYLKEIMKTAYQDRSEESMWECSTDRKLQWYWLEALVQLRPHQLFSVPIQRDEIHAEDSCWSCMNTMPQIWPIKGKKYIYYPKQQLKKLYTAVHNQSSQPFVIFHSDLHHYISWGNYSALCLVWREWFPARTEPSHTCIHSGGRERTKMTSHTLSDSDFKTFPHKTGINQESDA